jgi:hypothetical protein
MFTAIQSGGTRLIDIDYNGADPDDSELVIPDVAAATASPLLVVQ